MGQTARIPGGGGYQGNRSLRIGSGQMHTIFEESSIAFQTSPGMKILALTYLSLFIHPIGAADQKRMPTPGSREERAVIDLDAGVQSAFGEEMTFDSGS
jgi:hypothetical protein